MSNVNKVLAEQTLAKKFDFIMFIVNEFGEEKCRTKKETKKKFLAHFGDSDSFRVKLVDRYPEVMENDIFYIAKNGKTVWIREELE